MSDEPQITELTGLLDAHVPSPEGEDARTWRQALEQARREGRLEAFAKEIAEANPDDVMVQLVAASVAEGGNR